MPSRRQDRESSIYFFKWLTRIAITLCILQDFYFSPLESAWDSETQKDFSGSLIFHQKAMVYLASLRKFINLVFFFQFLKPWTIERVSLNYVCLLPTIFIRLVLIFQVWILGNATMTHLPFNNPIVVKIIDACIQQFIQLIMTTAVILGSVNTVLEQMEEIEAEQRID